MEMPKTATECAGVEIELNARRRFLEHRLKYRSSWDDFIEICRINNRLEVLEVYLKILYHHDLASRSRKVREVEEDETQDTLD